MIKAIISDLDGVLMDAKEWHFTSLNCALTTHGYPAISLEDHLSKYDGLPTKVKLKLLGVTKDKFKLIEQDKQFYTIQNIKAKYEQNLDTLNALKVLKNQGYRMALCSNSIRETVDCFLDVSEYDYYFEFTLSNSDVSSPKPNPEIYLKAINRMGLNPEEVLILEDNENGLRAAKASGAHVLKVEGGVKQVTYKFIMDKIKELDATKI